MSLYKLGVYEKAIPSELSWEDRLIIAKDAGYDYFEMSIDESDDKLSRLDWSRKERKELYDITVKVGIPFESICLSAHRKYPLGSPDENVQKQSLDIMEKACILAVDMGIRYIMIPGYDVYYQEGTQETRNNFIKNLKKCCEIASKYGVMLAFETMETSFMDTVEKSMEFVKLMDSPYLNVYPDIGNLNNASIKYSHSVTDDIDTGKGRIIATHIKETKPGHYREIPFTTGVVDFDKLVGACWKNGSRRFVTELWYTGQENWLGDLKFASHFARSIINKFAL